MLCCSKDIEDMVKGLTVSKTAALGSKDDSFRRLLGCINQPKAQAQTT